MSFRTLDLNLLRVFDAVMAEANLTRAAQSLAMTQPAVSNAVARLRDALADPLFVRNAHGVTPTARAHRIWPQIREALAQLKNVVEPAQFDAQHDTATFRLAMADATAALIMPPLITAIVAQAPQVNLRVIPLTTRDPRTLLEAGEADCAIGYFPSASAALVAQGNDAAFSSQRLYESRYVCVMRRGHPLAHGPLTLDAFCAAQHLLVSFSGRPFGFVDEALGALNRKRRILLTVNQFFTAGRVVAQTELLTVLPETFFDVTGYSGQLVTRELPFTLSNIHVDMFWHRRNERVPAQQWLRALFMDLARTTTFDAQ
jgi:DNA-binding transcriptional LysR family regulator